MRAARIPSYRLHKASGQAVVTIDGRDIYLGRFDSDESKREYERLVGVWKLRRKARRLPDLSIGQLVLLFDEHAKSYYVKGGRQTSEYGLIKLALRPLVRLYSREMVSEFGPSDLKRVRNEMVKGEPAPVETDEKPKRKSRKRAPMTRTTVNAFTRRIVRMFRWAVEEEYCPPDVLTGLEAVSGLRKGRSKARESEPVGPVPEADVNAVLSHVSRQVKDMIRLQLLSGCRPGEVVAIRPCDVNRDGAVWEYVPAGHKTEHHGRERRIFIGPRGQAVLAPYLDDRPAEAFCFSPIEAEAERRAKAHAERVTPLSCGNKPGSKRKGNPEWQPGEHYTAASYRKAIHRACAEANVPRWSPNQLRHTRATDLRRQFGIEAAQVVLGHAALGVTQVYAERDFEQARRVMSEIG